MRFMLGSAVALAVMPRALPAQPAPTPRAFRLLEWNISDSAWARQRAASRAVLQHADADVFVVIQVARDLDDAAIRGLLSGLRGASDTTWFVSSTVSDAPRNERTVIASRDSLRVVPEFASVPQRDTGHVRTNAALARVHGRWVMVTAVHFTCCGTPHSTEEQRRRAEAALIRDRVHATLARVAVDGVVIAGDMNLVGGRAPLDTLLGTRLPRRLGEMRRADAVHPDGWTDWTWDGRGGPFNGGRLDNVLYSDGELVATRALVYDTQFLHADTLAAHGLTAAMSKEIGRHRPVIVDFVLGGGRR